MARTRKSASGNPGSQRRHGHRIHILPAKAGSSFQELAKASDATRLGSPAQVVPYLCGAEPSHARVQVIAIWDDPSACAECLQKLLGLADHQKEGLRPMLEAPAK